MRLQGFGSSIRSSIFLRIELEFVCRREPMMGHRGMHNGEEREEEEDEDQEASMENASGGRNAKSGTKSGDEGGEGGQFFFFSFLHCSFGDSENLLPSSPSSWKVFPFVVWLV